MSAERIVRRRRGFALGALAPVVALLHGACGERVELGSDFVATPPPDCPPAPCMAPCPGSGPVPAPPPGSGPGSAACPPQPCPPLVACDPAGNCVELSPCPDPACIGKTCGAPCWLCPPGDPNCPPPPNGDPLATVCDPRGRCIEGAPTMPCPPPPPNLCEGMACGAPCVICGPNEPGCVESGIVKQCDAAHACVIGPIACP
jgi:hypothetical protein